MKQRMATNLQLERPAGHCPTRTSLHLTVLQQGSNILVKRTRKLSRIASLPKRGKLEDAFAPLPLPEAAEVQLRHYDHQSRGIQNVHL